MSDVESWIKEGKYDNFFHFHSNLGFGKQRSDYGRLKQQIDQVPLFSFNSGRYDINLLKSDLFAIIGIDNIKSVIKNPSYMCIATSNMKMLDTSNYAPASTSYDKFLRHISVAANVMTKLDVSVVLARVFSPFDSKLRGTNITDDDYEQVKFVWGYYGMTSIKDLLVWYNNLNVVPFIKAIKAQRELFMRFDRDMFADGEYLPGLSEKVMYHTCFNNLQYPDKAPANAFQFPAQRMGGYKSQDAKAEREFGMTLDHLDILLQKQKYLCCLCYCQLTAATASADRINNNLGHIDSNLFVSCIKCNTARKDMSLKGFRYKKLLEFNSDWCIALIRRKTSTLR
ncbi:unnamed protein product [Phytophthora lilii]|uniref:Unnamed protein product n=1 Tax=Phytophthora lilii TaxID=2077276 RepID=A0A9W6YKP4_9STRA|nr:unnamed protein product [Phytophthora lilii]